MTDTIQHLLDWAKEPSAKDVLDITRLQTKYGIVTLTKDEIVGDYNAVRALLSERIEACRLRNLKQE